MLKWLRTVGACLAALALIAGSPGLAAETDEAAPRKGSKQWTQGQIEALRDGQDTTRQQIETLEQGQKNIQKQLDEIKKLLQQKPQPRQPTRRAGPKVKDVSFNLGANDVKGHRDAKLTLIEFTDYQ